MLQVSLAQSPSVRFPAVAAGWHRIGNALAAMLRAWTTRRSLADLSNRELEDIGVTRHIALQEARRMPWDIAPLSRRG